MTTADNFYRETWIEIDLNAIAYNVKNTKKQLKQEQDLIAVVKADGYGHGAMQVAQAALTAGANYLAVASLDEALQLRAQGITAPILVLGATPVKYVEIASKQNITLTVFDRNWLQEAKRILRQTQQFVKIHIKADTGMGRLGISTVTELNELLSEADCDCIVLEGIFTHFATADELDETHLRLQVARFEELLGTMPTMPKMVHSSNSAGTLRFADMHYTAVRLGISLYGLTPSAAITDQLAFVLKPALSLHTKLVQVKQVAVGTAISYGATYQAAKTEWIGTLPIGYADGWLRKLSGQTVLIEGERVPIVGRVCMDQCMIRLPREFPVGTKVTLIGEGGNDAIRVEEIADRLETINYEVVCGLSKRVPRIYLQDNQVVAVKNALSEPF